jgi:hypothetical protein
MVDEPVPICVQCGYNLSALSSSTCPECAWPIDWRLARLRGEGWRIGTPAHRARGWRIIDRTLLTVLMMLVAPWRFARQLRADEKIWAPLAVALLSCAVTFVPMPFEDGWEAMAVFGAASASVVLCQTLVFSVLYFKRGPMRLRWLQRVRLWLIVSLYSTCFVATWRFTNGPPLVGSLTETNFWWPIGRSGSFWFDRELGVTIIVYWWWAILATVLIVRSRPWWLGVLALPLVFVFSWIGYEVGYWTYEWLD